MQKLNCPNCDCSDCYLDCDQSKSDHSLELDTDLLERMKYNTLCEAMECIQHNLVTFLDGKDQKFIDNVCQIVVDSIKAIDS